MRGCSFNYPLPNRPRGRSFKNMRFCETNPPFFDEISDGTFFVCDGYVGNCGTTSVGSFWKTNPKMGAKPGVGGAFEPLCRPNGDLRSVEVRGRETGAQRADPSAPGGRALPQPESYQAVRNLALRRRMECCETLRFAQGDSPGGYRWALDSLYRSDIVELESDKICRI